jgi:sulfur carrier protein
MWPIREGRRRESHWTGEPVMPAEEEATDMGSLQSERGEVSVVVNGEPMNVPTACRVTDLLEQLGLASRPVAVEINRVVVPRRQLSGHILAAGDQLEIVTLVGGG